MNTSYSYKFIVTEDLLDDYGHVNNAQYLKLYEDARWAILNQNDLGAERVRELKVGPVILEVTIRFSHEIILGEEVFIDTTSRRKGSKLFYFDQVMHDNKGKKFSKATFTSALFDMENRKMIIPDEKWLSAFGF